MKKSILIVLSLLLSSTIFAQEITQETLSKFLITSVEGNDKLVREPIKPYLNFYTDGTKTMMSVMKNDNDQIWGKIIEFKETKYAETTKDYPWVFWEFYWNSRGDATKTPILYRCFMVIIDRPTGNTFTLEIQSSSGVTIATYKGNQL